jgi:Phage integrase family
LGYAFSSTLSTAAARHRPVGGQLVVNGHVDLLRHSIATHLLDAGERIDFVQDHLGHRSIQSTMTYAQISDARRNRTMRRLERSREFPIPLVTSSPARLSPHPSFTWTATAFLCRGGLLALFLLAKISAQ